MAHEYFVLCGLPDGGVFRPAALAAPVAALAVGPALLAYHKHAARARRYRVDFLPAFRAAKPDFAVDLFQHGPSTKPLIRFHRSPKAALTLTHIIRSGYFFGSATISS